MFPRFDFRKLFSERNLALFLVCIKEKHGTAILCISHMPQHAHQRSNPYSARKKDEIFLFWMKHIGKPAECPVNSRSITHLCLPYG